MKHRSHKLVTGAIIGGVISGVAALLLTPKSGRCLKKGICDTCNNIADSTCHLGKCVCCHTDTLADKIKGLFGVEVEKHMEDEECAKDLFIGAAVGSVIGAIAGLVVAQKPGAELRQDIMETYSTFSDKTHETAADIKKQGEKFVNKAKKKANKWLEFANEALSEFSGDAREIEEEFVDRSRDQLNNVIEWAKFGMKLWSSLRK